ncbi:MyoB light chain [Balamuthia mandrillaris]
MANEVERLQEAFYNFDEDQDGLLSITDLRFIVENNGELMPDVEEFLAEAMQFDVGGGMIDYKAFAAMMMSEE